MKTILVIDDELGIADVLLFALEDEGYHVVVAHNGKIGLARAEEANPDLIMLDFMMPIMDGPATLQALRAHVSFANVPVVLMSSVDEDTVATHVSGYQAFVRKPFRFDQLISVISSVLSVTEEAGRAR